MQKRMDANNQLCANDKLIYPELSYEIVGILFRIHNELGNKYQEKYYQRALAIELENQKIKFKKELPVNLMYGNKKIGMYYLDFLIENKIVLETKATDKFRVTDYKQISGYLKCKNIKLGILVNFRSEKLSYKRIINPDLINY